MSIIQVALDFINEESSFDQEITALLNISRAPASQISYNIDARLADELLEGLLKHPAIIRADISDSEQRFLSSREKSEVESPYRWLSDLLFEPSRTYSTQLYARQFENYLLGHLTVVADTYPRGSQFLRRAAFTLLAGFVRSLILSVFLLILYYIMLTKPLLRVISAVSEVNPEKPEKVRLPVPAGHAKDEVGVLVASTNIHFQTIDDNLEKLREAEARLTSHSEKLEQTVANRTDELSNRNTQLLHSNQALTEAKEQALQRAEVRADFLASMSHEIRTPLNGVLGMIGLSLDEQLSESQREQLTIAHSSGLALLELLNDILDISKVEAGKLELEQISFNLRKTVNDVAALMAQNATTRDIGLYTLVDVHFPEKVIGDPTRIRQIISNLLNNAIKFTHNGYVSIKVKFIDNQTAEIRVSDTGIGIAGENLETIFSPFAQADQHTTRKFGGTGLGLTLCRQLSEQMQGKLTVTSSLNQGSTFKLSLPMKADQNAVAPALDSRLQPLHFLLICRQDNEAFTGITAQIRHWSLTSEVITYNSVRELALQSRVFSQTTIVVFDTDSIAPQLKDHKNNNHLILIMATHHHFYPGPGLLESSGINQLIRFPIGRDKLGEILAKAVLPNDQALSKARPQTQNFARLDQHVLLVEDNQVNQLVARTILQKLGYAVTIANNGKEAIAQVNMQEFSLVLMDCHMPVMDGFEATRSIRTDSRFQSLPIVAVTANVLEGDREKCLRCGMNDYMTKPYKRHVLVAMMAKWLTAEPLSGHS